MKIHPKNYYMLFQIGIWGLFMTYEGITYTIISKDYIKILLNLLLNYGIGIFITHIYRTIAIRWGWLNLNLVQLIPIAFFSMLVCTLVMTLINIPLDRWMFSNYFTLFNTTIFLSYFFNWSKYIAVWFLTYHLYILHIKSLKEKVQLVTALKEIEFNHLKNQLNPHFLFNALNSIRALIDENPTKSKEAVTLLSELLRRSLKITQNQFIPFEEEIKAIDCYLSLEKIRYEERLTYCKNIQKETLNLNFPPMMLQTIVENGIKHGISKLRNGGEISINSFIEGKAWYVQVISSGKLLVSEENSSKVGLKNTIERLQLLYGKNAYFRIEQLEENKVISEICIYLSI
jgi:sensor histidine kinase YesM